MTTVPDTISGLLRRGAHDWPDRKLILLEDGTTWTWKHAVEEGSRAANALASRGIGRGDRILLQLPNGADWLRCWWGAALIGAVLAPINPAYKGRLLTDICDTVGPSAIVCDPASAARFEQRHRELHIDPVRLTGGAPSIAQLDPPSRPEEPHYLMMTSGTTGPSKASITTNRFICFTAAWLVEGCGVNQDDVFLADLPWFHLSSLGPAVQMMRVGGQIAVRAVPAMTSYWQTCREFGTTFSIAPGTVAQFLESQPESAADRDHSMRFIVCSPLPSDSEAFGRRFGLHNICTAYGSTEANIVVVNTLDIPVREGSCGKARPGFHIKIVDEHDNEMPTGQIGELIVRSEQPWVQSQGYFNNPEATVQAWRNAWFHTGDALCVDENGYYYFHDRYKDSLRRRGENISSFEVERDVLTYPDIAEAACVAAPGTAAGDDEVKVFVVPELGKTIDFHNLLYFLAERMPYFMVPRYYQVVDDMPKTPSQRIQKYKLRELGNDDHTWDRDAAGYRLTRHGLEAPASSV